ncbi:hypothetical protein D3C79_674760 [compost metagenome]
MTLIARIETQRGGAYLLGDGDSFIDLRRYGGADLQVDIQPQLLGLAAKGRQLRVAQVLQGTALSIQDMDLDPAQPLLMGNVQQIGWQDLLQTHVHVERICVQIERQRSLPREDFSGLNCVHIYNLTDE